MSDTHKNKVAFSNRNGGGEIMKKLMVIACVMAMVMGLAGAASAYAIMGGPTTHSGGAFTITTVNDNLPTPASNPVGDQTWFVLADNQDWAGGSDPGVLNTKMNDTTPPATWTFAAYVDSAASDPSFTINVYGMHSTLIADLVGKTWELKNKETGEVLASNTWASTMTSASNALFNYTFENTTGMVGAANAVAFTLGEAEIVPEPGSMVAMFSGLVGLVGFGIRRRK